MSVKSYEYEPFKGWHLFALGAAIGFLLPKILSSMGDWNSVPALAPLDQRGPGYGSGIILEEVSITATNGDGTNP